MEKYYVHRNESNDITKITRWPNGSTEQLEKENPEVQAYLNQPELTNDEIYDQTMKNSVVIRAFALSLNDGSFVPGSNLSGIALKTIIKEHM